jgi:hypothetical protein
MADERDANVARRRIQDNLEDTGTNTELARGSYANTKPVMKTPFFADHRAAKFSEAADRDLVRGDYDAAPPISSPSGKGPETGYAMGGKVTKHGSPTCCGPGKYKHG